jgi:uncharacterized protein
LYLAFKDRKFDWLVSNEILLEYEEQLTIFYSEKTADLVLSILSVAPNVVFNDPFYKWNLIDKDEDDNKFADTAITGNADYLVTNDRDFNILKSTEFPKINIVSITEFEQILLGK